jgi:serine/threonine protein kinase
MIGKTISRYRILEKLGEGGRSSVYKAEDVRLERIVAIKLLAERLHNNPKARIRFLREAQAVAQLEHPNICHVYEVDSVEKQTYMAMAYVDGQSLTQRLENGPMEVDEAIDIGIQAAEGLNAAHKKEIIHRDIKDANIMINEEGVVKILDFGLSKALTKENITRPRTILGTVPYMSPEQITGKPVDYGTDIWSLGVVMYRMLTGKHPFEGRNMPEMMRSIAKKTPARIRDLRKDFPEPLDLCIQKMMEKDRRLRHNNMEEVIEDLRRVKSH